MERIAARAGVPQMHIEEDAQSNIEKGPRVIFQLED